MQVKQIQLVKNILEHAPVIDNVMAQELDELKALLNTMNSSPRIPKNQSSLECASA